MADQDVQINYYDLVPEEIINGMTSKARMQYFFWNDIFKWEIEHYPEFLLPLVKEIFKEEYPEKEDVMFLSAGYTVRKTCGREQERIELIHADLQVKIGSSGLCCMGYRIGQNENMAVRMVKYDMGMTLIHDRGKEDDAPKYEVKLPKIATLYLDDAGGMVDSERCGIVFQDGTEYGCCGYTLKAQEYTPEMIFDKGLVILLPFLPLRFWHRLNKLEAESGRG